MTEIKGKICIVTGATSGIGRAIALRFKQEGATVIGVGRNRAGLKELKKSGIDAEYADITIASEVNDLFKRIDKRLKKYGRLDVLVNNAGVLIWDELEKLTEADFDNTIAVNLKGVFLMTKQAVSIMKKQQLHKSQKSAKNARQNSGLIINISSGAGRHPREGGSIYCASKYGIMGFSESIALELKKYNIRVSVICPGHVDTPIFALPKLPKNSPARTRMLRPEDVADMCAYVASLPEHVVIPETHIRPFFPE